MQARHSVALFLVLPLAFTPWRAEPAVSAGAALAPSSAVPTPPGNAGSQATAPQIAPGQTTPLLLATACEATTEGPTGGECVVCTADCDGLAENEAHAFVVTPGFPLGLGRRVATCTVSTGFSVSATAATQDNPLPLSTVNYDIEWRGFWFIVAALDLFDSVQEMTIHLELRDDTSQGQLVKSELIQKGTVGTLGFEDIFEGATKVDTGDKKGTFDVTLKRGHSYTLRLVLRVESSASLGAVIDIDYATLEKGAKWNELTVAAGLDTTQVLADLQRVAIEQNLKEGNDLASLYLPSEFGGQLETVVALVDDLVASSAAAGMDPNNASYWIDQAHAELGRRDFRLAYERAKKAYQLLTK